jgi:hypothetical protein
MRKSLKWLLLLTAVLGFAILAKMFAGNETTPQLTADQTIEQTVDFWKNRVPVEIDKKTILVGVEASAKTLIYKFKIKTQKADINLANFPNVVASALKRTTCENSRKAASLKLGVQFLHIFHDENMEEIYRMTVQQRDC